MINIRIHNTYGNDISIIICHYLLQRAAIELAIDLSCHMTHIYPHVIRLQRLTLNPN